MRIAFVEIAGFRGVRAPLRIEIPPGFLVITGRNGSGKSTICDAIEFALTGTISKYGAGKERGESIDDYVWWRGYEPADRAHVLIGIQSLDGRLLTIQRDSRGLRMEPNVKLSEYLCDAAGAPADALQQLCRTTIIRDETLAALSVDQTETDRFEFVRAALGTHALDNAARSGRAVEKTIRDILRQAEEEYDRVRNDVALLVEQVSEAKVAAAGADTVQTALAQARELLGLASGELAVILPAARSRVSEIRHRVEGIEELRRSAATLRGRLETVGSAEWQAAVNRQRDDLRRLRDRLSEFQGTRKELSTKIAQYQQTVLGRTDRAALYTHGHALGLQGGKCPLCASPISEQRYRAALESLRDGVRQDEASAAVQTREMTQLVAQMDSTQATISEVALALVKDEATLSQLQSDLQALRTAAASLRI